MRPGRRSGRWRRSETCGAGRGVRRCSGATPSERFGASSARSRRLPLEWNRLASRAARRDVVRRRQLVRAGGDQNVVETLLRVRVHDLGPQMTSSCTSRTSTSSNFEYRLPPPSLDVPSRPTSLHSGTHWPKSTRAALFDTPAGCRRWAPGADGAVGERGRRHRRRGTPRPAATAPMTSRRP